MAIKTTLWWGILLVSVSSACDQLRVPRAPASTSAAPPRTPRPARPAETAPSGGGSAVNEATEFDRIRTGLRRLVVAEETFFAENGTYTDDLDRLQYKPAAGSAVRFLWVSGTGWAASGTNAGITGKDCVIYVGRDRGAPTTLKYVRKGKEGVPVCDAAALPKPTPKTTAQRPSAAPTPPPATATPPATPPATRDNVASDTTSALDAVNPVVALKVDLRNLVRSQQTFYAQQGLYARSTEPFALQYLWHRGVTITILSADVESWSARATHTAWRGRSCVVYFGSVPTRPATAADKHVADEPSEPVCDN
jgi:hypothetical protein